MNIVNEIQSLIDLPIDPSLFPVKKGNVILVGNTVVKQVKQEYRIYDENKLQRHSAQTKIAAIAIARNLYKARNQTPEILRLDRMISKNLQDIVYFDHIYKNTDDCEKREILDMKLGNARSRVLDAQEKLHCLIFPKRLNTRNVNSRKPR